MTHRISQFKTRLLALLGLVALVCAGIAQAQLPVPPSTQFDITGFLQEATVTPAGGLGGGSLKVNGHVVTVPSNTIVIFPANAVTWEEVFSKAPAPYTGVASGLAMADVPTPLTTYEVQVIGNRVGDTYIAGLIYISQQGLNQGAGFINFIDYALGEMRVGGIINDPNCAQGGTLASNPACSGTRVRLNDPMGRYGRITTTPDVRFTVDPDNPTVIAGTGYPMCFPRTLTDPTAGGPDDPLCPQGNRPRVLVGAPAVPAFAASFTTNNNDNVLSPPILPGVFPDSTKQAPLEVGDYVTFAGTLVQDCPACPGGGTTAGPWPLAGTGATWIAAHTITNNVAIFTFPGSNPAYIETDTFILGTGGLSILGVGEAAVRTRFEGMMTDPSRSVHLYGIDLDVAGNSSDRDWGTIGVDQGPPTGAVKGRWRFRPPCAPFGTVPAKPATQCVMNAAGTFLPPPREMRSVIEGMQSQNPANPGALTSANGLFYGQYHAPILSYIFPENIPGSPIVENNFNAFPFLACGGYSSSGIGIPPTAPVLARGPLSPWPSNIAPLSSACVGAITPPSVTASATPSSVISGTGTIVNLSATATGSAPLTVTWTQAATDVPQVVLTPAGNNATFTTPVVAANTTLNFTVTATNAAGSQSANVSVTVAFDQPVVNTIPFQSVLSGTPATINITGTDPGGLPLTFTVTQTAGPAPNTSPLTVTQVPPSGARANFTETLALGAPAVTLNFNVVATNTAGVSSVPVATQVTVNPQPDAITIASAEYRTGLQRLIVNANSSVISPNVILKLQPYLTEAGTTYNPDPAAGGGGNVLTNNGGGLYIITLVGVPRPACNLGGTYATPCAQRPIVVTSNLGGASAPSALTRIRQ
jgi:immunoglobulin I-set domain protein